MKDWSVYALWSQSFNRFYISMSSDIASRIKDHNAGKQKSTKAFIPYDLIYTEKCTSRLHARESEKYWKSCEGREKLKEILRSLSKEDSN
jgi:putative endonuclease